MPSSIIDSNGVERFLGNNPPDTGLVKAWPIFGDVPEIKMIPRSEWDNLIPDGDDPSDVLLSPTRDQDGIGMCNASATVSGIEDTRAKQGLPQIHLSAGDLYRQICGGQDRGSTLEDGIVAAMTTGVCTAATTPYLEWRRNSAQGAIERPRFRVLEAFLCPTFDHCMSAVLASPRPFSLITGILWFNNYNPESDGWLPRGRGQSGGHAIRGYKATRKGSKYGIWHKQSWGENWFPQFQNSFVIPEDRYTNAIGGWWAIRSVVDEGGNVPPPV